MQVSSTPNGTTPSTTQPPASITPPSPQLSPFIDDIQVLPIHSQSVGGASQVVSGASINQGSADFVIPASPSVSLPQPPPQQQQQQQQQTEHSYVKSVRLSHEQLVSFCFPFFSFS